VLVRRTGSRLGIDINERNVIVKLIPGTHAAREKQLREGDVVVAVDGEALNGRWLAQAPALPRRVASAARAVSSSVPTVLTRLRRRCWFRTRRSAA